MAEGAPLLRVYIGNSIEGSNPSLSATHKKAPPVSGGAFLCVAESEYY